MKVSPDDPHPAYLQIASILREDISTGKLKPGKRLPSGRELAKEFGAALMTVQHALSVLREEGLVVTEQGRGVFVRAPSPPGGHPSEARLTESSLASKLEAIHDELRRMNERLSTVEQHLREQGSVTGDRRTPTRHDRG